MFRAHSVLASLADVCLEVWGRGLAVGFVGLGAECRMLGGFSTKARRVRSTTVDDINPALLIIRNIIRFPLV